MKSIFSLFFIIAISTKALALGGTSVKDGGQGLACGSHVELLDLYEARHLTGHEILTSTHAQQAVSNQIMAWWNILQSFNVTPAHDYGIDDAFVMGLSPSIPTLNEPDSFIAWITDFPTDQIKFDYGKFIIIPPPGCHLIQLGLWDPKFGAAQTITLSSNRWQQLDSVDQAALLLHETLHSYFDRDHNNLAIRELLVFLTGTPAYQKSHIDVLSDLLATRRAIDIRRLQ